MLTFAALPQEEVSHKNQPLCRAMEGLFTAVRTLQIAPVETAKAVQVTVEGTASMVGQAFQSCTETVKAATEESIQQLAESTRNAKVHLHRPTWS